MLVIYFVLAPSGIIHHVPAFSTRGALAGFSAEKRAGCRILATMPDRQHHMMGSRELATFVHSLRKAAGV